MGVVSFKCGEKQRAPDEGLGNGESGGPARKAVPTIIRLQRWSWGWAVSAKVVTSQRTAKPPL